MKKTLLRSILFIGFTSLISGCYNYGAEYIDELDIVYTNYQKDYSFKGQPTYAMPDKIVKINGSTSGDKLYIDPIYANQIFSRIQSNMSSLGYTLVTDSTQADFILFPSATEVTNVSYSYDYWSYYYGWYYPPYYGGWYYPYSYSYSYQTGSLIMNMNARKDISANGTSPIVWIGIINGLLEGDNATLANRVNKSIDQAFNQSQYLHQ